jgi:transcriptional regulator with XRE-family HTH domain
MFDLLDTQRGYTPGVIKRRVSHEAHEPVWRVRIATAIAPHGRLKAIADEAGMKSPQLQKIANGTTEDPGVATLARVARAMGLTLEQLVSTTRPEGEAGHGAREPEGLADSLRRAVAGFEQTGQFPPDWRGDVMLAIFTLTRALQRPVAVAAEPPRQAKKAER